MLVRAILSFAAFLLTIVFETLSKFSQNITDISKSLTTISEIERNTLSRKERLSLFIILLGTTFYFKTDIAIGYQWFMLSVVLSFFGGIILATRNVEKTELTEKYIVPDNIYSRVSGIIMCCMFLYFLQGNLICGSTLNQVLTMLLLYISMNTSSLIGKEVICNKSFFILPPKIVNFFAKT